MSLLGSVIGAVGGIAGNALGGVASSALGQYYNKKNMADQFNYKMRELREAPTNYRKGLESAGYNPLLALPNSMSASGVTSSNPSTSMDLLSGAKQGAKLANEIEELWKDEDRQRDANWLNTKKNSELLSAQIRKVEAEAEAVKNQSNINSAKEGRNQILDWVDSVSPYGFGLGGYLFGKARQNKVPKNPKVPIIPLKNSSKGSFFKGVIKKAAVPSILGATAYATSRRVVNNFVKQAEEESKKKNSKYNPWEFSPIGGYWAW